MHIAFLTPEFPHPKTLHVGGLGTSIKNLVQALAQRVEKVSVIVYGQKTDEVIQENNITIYLIQDQKYAFAKWFFYRKHIEKRVNHIIASEKIDAVEAPDWTGITAFMKFSVPLVLRFHGSDTYFCHLENRKQKKKNYWFEKLAVNGAKAYITPTQFAGDLSRKLFSIKNKTIQTIHYGLELDKFHNSNPNDFQKGLILYLGTIIRKKGVFELPEIFNKVRKECPQTQLLLIGNDSRDIQTGNSSTWEMVKNSFDTDDFQQVTYLGKIPYSEVQEYIKKANVCVFPTFAETLGMVTIESMAMQKAVVNSNIGWAQELIDDGKNGFLVHPKNHTEYAQRIVSLISDESLNEQIRSQALQKVKDTFAIEKCVQQNIDFYRQLIQKTT